MTAQWTTDRAVIPEPSGIQPPAVRSTAELGRALETHFLSKL